MDQILAKEPSNREKRAMCLIWNKNVKALGLQSCYSQPQPKSCPVFTIKNLSNQTVNSIVESMQDMWIFVLITNLTVSGHRRLCEKIRMEQCYKNLPKIFGQYA